MVGRSLLLPLLALAVSTAGCLAPEDEDEPGSDAQALTEAGAFFTYNICGGDPKCKVADPTAAVVDNVVQHRPVAFALQEVCSGQADRISRELRKRNLPYVQRFQNAASKAVNLGCGGLEGWGNAVFHVGDRLGEVVEDRFEEQQGNFITRVQNRGYVCVHVPRPDFWACSTHIDVQADKQAAQIDELERVGAGLTKRGGAKVPVVVAGDFNVVPDSSRIDAMFASSYARGSGSFVEDDVRTDRTATAPTHGSKKIDYVFRTPDVEVSSSTVVNATSDHRLVLQRLRFPRR